MFKLKDEVEFSKLTDYNFKLIPAGIYAKSIDCYINGIGDKIETFITVEQDRTLQKYKVKSYLGCVYDQVSLHIWKRDIKDLYKANILERG